MGTNPKTIVVVAIVALIAGFLLKSIFSKPEIKIIEVPIEIPSIVKQTDTIYLDSIIEIEVPGRDNTIVEVDSAYYYKYLKEKDKTRQLEIFVDAIKVQDTTITLEDSDTIKIDVWSKTRGKLLAQSAKYFIKPRTIIVPVEVPAPPRYNIYGGIYTDIPYSSLGKFGAGVKLSLDVKNKTIYSFGYDTNSNIMLGVSKSLFTIK